MYIPAHFQETDPSAIAAMIAAHPLAQVVAHTDQGLVANPLPLLAVNETTLVGHLALANDMHRIVPNGADVLVIFQGGDAYVSPNWYPSKSIDHKVVPTWNYETVQMHGRISFQHDMKSKIAAVGRLTKTHEQATNEAQAWKMADAPPDYMAQMLDGIVAFQIDIGRVFAKSKLSQNKSADDINGVADALHQRGDKDIAAAMLQSEKPV
ncbi:FMN-binding negative transcriptional regulator [Yoonia sp. I 8.24]|uniref:FMN-binding negative transcriptional regulator n=1 Tax=Yoonia sp. I 8.24 TaxID=1537229 RepID=UPI001EDE0631|nr:FMN-binding negative transcriptional regulator [Yoonia sp. I 8.24]MCG3267723.1 FMN-binding negative transcriptional regulator [Yoonia sp. I 8.24]